MLGKKPLLAYFGHHKCASTWINSILDVICNDLNLRLSILHNPHHTFRPSHDGPFSGDTTFDKELDKYTREKGIQFLSYTNANKIDLANFDNISGFHVIRDPRDIVVSAYFSHLNSHSTTGWPRLVEYRKNLQKVDKDEGLFMEFEFRKGQFEAMYNWNYSDSRILEIKMEELIRSPFETMVSALSHLNLVDANSSYIQRILKVPLYLFSTTINRLNKKNMMLMPFSITQKQIPLSILLEYIFIHRFSKISGGRKIGQEDNSSHYRKGVSGDWANHFNKEHIKIFKDRYGDLLIKLGYEKDNSW